MVAVHGKQPGHHHRIIVPEHYAGLPVLARQSVPAQAIQTVSDTAQQVALSRIAPTVETRPLSVYGQLSEVTHA